jgi:hypothetical protein
MATRTARLSAQITTSNVLVICWARLLQPSQFLAEFLGVVAHGTRGVVRLIGIYSQMIHDFLDGSAFVRNEPTAAGRSVLTPICHLVDYTSTPL